MKILKDRKLEQYIEHVLSTLQKKLRTEEFIKHSRNAKFLRGEIMDSLRILDITK